jgi:hypothetical protein
VSYAHPEFIVSRRYFTALLDLEDQLHRQIEKWGLQSHPDGTAENIVSRATSDNSRKRCDQAAEGGTVTWRHILTEEVDEAYAESDPVKLRKELIQVAAVALAWVEDIDRRGS